MLIFFFFFGGCGAWGSALYWLVNGGVAHIVATCLILIGWGVLFPMKTFSGFPHFSRQKPFDLYLSSFFPCYFFTFSLRLAFLTSLVAHFAHSLLSFLLIFRYALYLCSYPFWISFFFFSCVSLSLSSSVVSFNGGLLWSWTHFSFRRLSFHPLRGFIRIFYRPIGCAFTPTVYTRQLRVLFLVVVA